MKAVILCGGQGTRIRGVADDLPKPMIPIGERPILWHIMRTYSYYGINDFVLCLGYKGWAIKEFFLNLEAHVSDVTLELGSKTRSYLRQDGFIERDWKVTLAETGIETQTGGRMHRIRDYVAECELFCATYGDGVADIDVEALVSFHRRHGKVATVTGVRPPGRFGVMNVERDPGGLTTVTRFSEKPQAGEGLINGGFFVFDQRFFEYLDDDPGLILEAAPLQRLASDGELVMFEHEGFWQPMDTFREWRLLNDLWEKGDAPWRR